MVETDQSAYSIFQVQDDKIDVLCLGGNLTDYSNSDNLSYTGRYDEENRIPFPFQVSVLIVFASVVGAQAKERPNILWLTSEDNNVFVLWVPRKSFLGNTACGNTKPGQAGGRASFMLIVLPMLPFVPHPVVGGSLVFIRSHWVLCHA